MEKDYKKNYQNYGMNMKMNWLNMHPPYKMNENLI